VSEVTALARMLLSTPAECYRIAKNSMLLSGESFAHATAVGKRAAAVARYRWRISGRIKNT
jgi:hypothetical protein